MRLAKITGISDKSEMSDDTLASFARRGFAGGTAKFDEARLKTSSECDLSWFRSHSLRKMILSPASFSFRKEDRRYE